MYNFSITITEVNLKAKPHIARGTILQNGEEIPFEAAHMVNACGVRRSWKVVEQGLISRSEPSQFSRKERVQINLWVKAVLTHRELLGKCSGPLLESGEIWF